MAKVKNDFTAAFMKRKDATLKQAKESTKEAAVMIMENAINRAPEDTGELKDSAFIDESGASIAFGFDADHALWTHEITNRNYTIGEPKYLRNAISDYAGKGKQVLQRQLKNALEKGEVQTGRAPSSIKRRKR